MSSNKNKIYITLLIVILFFAGYVLGALIGKAKVNKNKVPDSAMISLLCINSRVTELQTYCSLTSKSLVVIPQMSKYSSLLDNIGEIASKIDVFSKASIESAMALRRGEDSPSYNTQVNRMILYYKLLDINVSVIPEVIDQMKQYPELAALMDLWIDYEMIEAMLHDDFEKMQYWQHIGYSSSEADLSKYVSSLPEETRDVVRKCCLFDNELMKMDSRISGDSVLSAASSLYDERTDTIFDVKSDNIDHPEKLFTKNTQYINSKFFEKLVVIE